MQYDALPESADQADDQIADQPEAAALHHPPRQPAGDDANNEYDQKALVRKEHGHPQSSSPR